MKLTVISLIILISISVVSALEFSLESPAQVNQNEPFTVFIGVPTLDTYDVKIYVLEDKSTVSEVEYDGWKNSFYYLAAAIPHKTSYQVRVPRSTGDLQICARLRKTNTTVTSDPVCQPIHVVAAQQPSFQNTELEREDPNENPQRDVFVTRQEYLRIGVALSFTLLLVVILILLFYRKL